MVETSQRHPRPFQGVTGIQSRHILVFTSKQRILECVKHTAKVYYNKNVYFTFPVMLMRMSLQKM